ncbi:HAD superfamily hydrolase (TIGR01509 family)/HAD superfamily hydrolase (TIGR01549 family) [Natranaerovirga pectinivora]|uniref:HAD superfamily hydrolase (TIGR01509 family)/HAD superfamily hydrolase (TIGR01549 family) n=1 Tax=Natranaerovirga pectinivora TaxID=682400 RepID=A0A4R3MR30_9FIRM|nr:HAD family phosphatase [Natranaerovirga pectinivora]TCT17234.1 HAD superfamily hydrolase (TIGR01509 family)/HAD superfamily hydrolase (TIGR01549 family) [Natranaerovirga pectinivora]
MEKQLEIELIIFDMDGLMFDTENISYIAWKEAANQYNYQISRDLFEKTVGTNITKTKEIYVDYFGEKFPFNLIRDERVKISNEFIKINGVPIKKGLYELIQYLDGINIKKAVATSTSRNRALNLLSLAEIDGFFDYILCGDEIENSKPNPEIFLNVADKLQCTPSKCLVLEDSETGISAAYQAGMIPIMISDLKEPSEEIQSIIHCRMDNLLDVKSFLEENF